MSAMRAALAPAAVGAAAPISAPTLNAPPHTVAQATGLRARAPLYSRQRKLLGDPTPLACTVAKAAVEAVLGSTSLGSLIRWLAPEVRDSLAQQHSLARRAGYASAPAVAVKRARVCRVSAEACEVSIVVHCEGRARAVAMRLDDVAGRWLVTAMEIG